MSKLSLKIEDLAVASFETSEEQAARGTVRAHESESVQIACGNTFDVGTCDLTCAVSCQSCAETCGGTGTGPGTRQATCVTGTPIHCQCGA